MPTVTANPITARQLGVNGEIYLGARATALLLHDRLSVNGLERRKCFMRVLATDFKHPSERADLLLDYAYDDAGHNDRHLLLATVLAFHGTSVVGKPEDDAALSGTPLTGCQFNYWKEKLIDDVEGLVQIAYNP